MDLANLLFLGFNPDDIFGGILSVDASELFLVFGTVALSLGLMVLFGNWWSR